jgi:hypothetical protein
MDVAGDGLRRVPGSPRHARSTASLVNVTTSRERAAIASIISDEPITLDGMLEAFGEQPKSCHTRRPEFTIDYLRAEWPRAGFVRPEATESASCEVPHERGHADFG